MRLRGGCGAHCTVGKERRGGRVAVHWPLSLQWSFDRQQVYQVQVGRNQGHRRVKAPAFETIERGLGV